MFVDLRNEYCLKINKIIIRNQKKKAVSYKKNRNFIAKVCIVRSPISSLPPDFRYRDW